MKIIRALTIALLVSVMGCASAARVKKVETELGVAKASYIQNRIEDQTVTASVLHILDLVSQVDRMQNSKIQTLEDKYDQAFSTKTGKGARFVIYRRRANGTYESVLSSSPSKASSSDPH